MAGFKGNGSKIIPFANIGIIPSLLFSSQYDKNEIFGANHFNISLSVSPGLMMSERVSMEARISKSIIGIYDNNNFNYFSLSFLLGYRLIK